MSATVKNYGFYKTVEEKLINFLASHNIDWEPTATESGSKYVHFNLDGQFSGIMMIGIRKEGHLQIPYICYEIAFARVGEDYASDSNFYKTVMRIASRNIGFGQIVLLDEENILGLRINFDVTEDNLEWIFDEFEVVPQAVAICYKKLKIECPDITAFYLVSNELDTKAA
jgi:hypothetical protein